MANRVRFIIPNSITIETETYERAYGHFTAGPFERGWATTIANALRRVLLSSIEGAAIIAVRVNDYLHEFASIPGVKEDVFDILLNLRFLPIISHSDSAKRIRLKADTIGVVTANRIEHDDDVEIVDDKHYICTMGDEGSIELEMILCKGRGFIPAERNKEIDLPRGFIPVSSFHSPVKKVKFHVDPTRVGEQTRYETLSLEIWTNGTLTPVESLHRATSLLQQHFDAFTTLQEPKIEKKVPEETPDLVATLPEEPPGGQKDTMTIEELGLPVRIVNVLHANGIQTVKDIRRLTRKQVASLASIGPKSLQEILRVLDNNNIELPAEPAG